MDRHDLKQLVDRLREKTRRDFYLDWAGPLGDPIVMLLEYLENPREPNGKEITGPLSITDACRYIEGFLAGFDLGFTATWKCEDCGAIAEWSHVDAEDGGTPTCTECSTDMVLYRFGRAEKPDQSPGAKTNIGQMIEDSR